VVKDEMIPRVAICALCLLLALSAVAPVSGLRVDGAVLKADVSPGDHIRHEMTVRIGEGEQPVEARAEVMGFGTRPDGMIVPVGPGDDSSPHSAREFFEVHPESFRLEPGVPVKVVLEGDVPVDVGSGGRYAVVEIHTAPQGWGTVGYVTAITVPVYLTINGTEIVKTGEIAEIVVSEDEVLSISFENTGNYFYGVAAEVVLRDEGEDVVKTITTQKGTVLPAVPYSFTISLNSEGDLTPGSYTVEARVIRSDGEVVDSEVATFEV